MVYKFNDIYNNEMYKTANVLLILGSYDIFNNIVIDECRKRCIPENDNISTSFLESIAKDLPMRNSDSYSDSSMNILEFKEFMELNRAYPLEGRWFCNIDYSILKEKEKDSLKEYIKHSNETGLLVVNIREFKEYRDFLKSRTIQNSKVSHMIQLSFPSKNMLMEILNSEFRKNKVIVSDKALKLFILRLSNEYNSYNDVIQDIIEKYSGMSMGYDDMLTALEGIDNYVLDDFLAEITKGVRNDKFRKNRKIYKMYKSLLDSMSAKDIVNKLKYKVDMMLELRMAINDGILPILVRYGSKEIQDKLPEGSKSKSLSTYAFKKYAKIASLTTLKDWYYIKMILNGNSSDVSYNNDDYGYRHILLSIMHRTTFSPNRLLNNLGIINVIDEELYDLNTVFYNPSINLTEEAMLELIRHNNELLEKRDIDRSEFGKELEKKLRKLQSGGSRKVSKVNKIESDLESSAMMIQEMLANQSH